MKILLRPDRVLYRMREMIRLAVREIAERRGIKNANQLKDKTGFPPATAAQLWKGEGTRIEFRTLDTLCAVLKCRPNDLLRYEPDE